VLFGGKDITGLPAHRIRRLGLTYVPEGRGIFPGLSVTDNLRMAVAKEPRHDRSTAIERAVERFPVLGERLSQRAGSLSGGEQQMLALARAFGVPESGGGAELGYHDRPQRTVRAPRPGHG
jgi:branched-chain amino acid transport system ATP-binding protein